MTRFLASPDLATLLEDLAGAGFVLTNPNPFDIVQTGTDACIYLGHVPIGQDDNGTIYSTDFCANVTACEGHVFSTEIPAPSVPYNIFAE